MATNGKRGNPGWQKGTSGNPGGRRKQDYRIKDLAQEHTLEALKRLREIMNQSVDLRAAVSAATHLLDRGYGKCVQSVDLTNSDSSLAAMFSAAVRAANGLTEEASEDTGRSGATH